MEQVLIFIFFILGIVLGVVVPLIFFNKKIKELELDLKRTEQEKQETETLLRSSELRTGKEEIAFGLTDFNQKAQEIKDKRKQAILDKLEEKGKIQTNQTADLLEVSRATAFRYLEEMEQENKIEQIGSFGRNVEYKIKGR
jgi:predicted transcriptional regulator YheO